MKNAPYSAEMITEANQPLADGNVISRRTTGAVYRDGEGRVRQETGGDGRERTIYINDPVAGKTFVLSPGSKKAVATSLPNARLRSTLSFDRVKEISAAMPGSSQCTSPAAGNATRARSAAELCRAGSAGLAIRVAT